MNKKSPAPVSPYSNKGGEKLIGLLADPLFIEYFQMGRDMYSTASTATIAWVGARKPHISKQARAMEAFNMGWEVGEHWSGLPVTASADLDKLADEVYRKYFRLGQAKFSRSITPVIAWASVEKPVGRPSSKLLAAFQDGWDAEALFHKGETSVESPE